jgi:hypothetical protein
MAPMAITTTGRRFGLPSIRGVRSIGPLLVSMLNRDRSAGYAELVPTPEPQLIGSVFSERRWLNSR